MAQRYEIRTLADLLAVPIERRGACLRQIEYALALHEFAAGAQTPPSDFQLAWTDDGCRDVQLEVNGEPLLTLAITEGAGR